MLWLKQWQKFQALFAGPIRDKSAVSLKVKVQRFNQNGHKDVGDVEKRVVITAVASYLSNKDVVVQHNLRIAGNK